MEITADRWRGIKPKVKEEPAGSGRYRVTFVVSRLARSPGLDGEYPRVPDEAHAIIQARDDGELHVVQYTRPECETGESATDWQALAVEAARDHLAALTARDLGE